MDNIMQLHEYTPASFGDIRSACQVKGGDILDLEILLTNYEDKEPLGVVLRYIDTTVGLRKLLRWRAISKKDTDRVYDGDRNLVRALSRGVLGGAGVSRSAIKYLDRVYGYIEVAGDCIPIISWSGDDELFVKTLCGSFKIINNDLIENWLPNFLKDDPQFTYIGLREIIDVLKLNQKSSVPEIRLHHARSALYGAYPRITSAVGISVSDGSILNSLCEPYKEDFIMTGYCACSYAVEPVYNNFLINRLLVAEDIYENGDLVSYWESNNNG